MVAMYDGCVGSPLTDLRRRDSTAAAANQAQRSVSVQELPDEAVEPIAATIVCETERLVFYSEVHLCGVAVSFQLSAGSLSGR